MSIELKEENIFNFRQARTIKVTDIGFSPEEMESLKQQALEMSTGEVDVICVSLEPGVEYTEVLDSHIRKQLDDVFKPLCADSPFTLPLQGNYCPLHVDAQLNGMGNAYLEDIEIRIHCNPGNHKISNIPAVVPPSSFDPYMIFGRIEKPYMHPNTLIQSYETFKPSFAVNLMKPTWNIFRSHGKHAEGAKNAPVSHSVIPRVLAQDVLDPDSTFTPMVNDDQKVVNGNNSRMISIEGRTPYKGPDGQPFGVMRSFELINYPVGRSRGIARGLVA